MCSNTIEEFEEQMYEAQVNMKKAEILHKRAQGTAHLVSDKARRNVWRLHLLTQTQLSDLLDYENAQIAQLNEKSLNGLVKESKEENSKMRLLTVRRSMTLLHLSTLEIYLTFLGAKF
jgi:hypothetical protein